MLRGNQPHRLGHRILYSVGGFTRLYSVGKGAVWNLWQALVENHNTDLWDSEVRSDTVEGLFTLWEISVLLALVNTEHLVMEHILTIHLKLPIMSWILLHQSNHNIKQTRTHSSGHEKVAQTTCHPLRLHQCPSAYLYGSSCITK